MPEPTTDHPPPESDAVAIEAFRCRNCGEQLKGRFCHRCGQKDQVITRFFPSLLLEGLEGLFAFESRTYRTLWLLFTRPAFLSREYLEGRRVRYLPPVRVFIIFVLIFLFTVSVELFFSSIGISLDPDEDQPLGPTPVEVDAEPVTAGAASSATQGSGGTEISLGFQISSDEEDFLPELVELIGQLHVPFLSKPDNERFIALLQDRATTNVPVIQQDPGAFFNQLVGSAPALMLLMLPILALIQKLFYLGSGRYYIEHLVLVLHNQSFLFLTFILSFLLNLLALSELRILDLTSDFLVRLLGLWVIVYLYWSLRAFFQQGYLVTGCKFIVISLLYGALFITGILAYVLVGMLLY
jgi:hypothetical protein